MEQVDRLRSSGDVAGLVQAFLAQRAVDFSASPTRDRMQAMQDVRSAKKAVATALAELGTPEALDALVGLLETSPGETSPLARVGEEALGDALASFPDARALDALVRLARDHERSEVRKSAAGILTSQIDRFGDRRDEAIDALISVLDDREWSVRWEVAHRISVALRTRQLQDDARVVELLTRLLADPDQRVRRIAEQAPGVLKREVMRLAEERGWPHLDLGGNPVAGLIAGAVGGMIVGLGILAVLTRGELEGILVLLGGGGGGLGLIIVAVAVLGIAAWGFVTSKLKEIKAGSDAWGRWLASATDADLNEAKARLGRQA